MLKAIPQAGVAMRDPMTWALPLYRAWGIHVKVHLFFFFITLPLYARLLNETKGVHWLDLFMLTVGFVFILVLLHEYGHCFSARFLGGSAEQILIWPLGGLAYCEVPHTPRAHFWCALWGPLVNAFVCLACAVVMLLAGFSPLKAFNPLGNPLTNSAYNISDGRTYTSDYGYSFYKPGTAEAISTANVARASDSEYEHRETFTPVERAVSPVWLSWVWRICWLSWGMFLFNMLIPAYPMDCGRILHAIIWARTDYRNATIRCCYVGYVVGGLMLVMSIFINEVLLTGMGLFILVYCYRTLTMEQEAEANGLGYDFSQGYTSLEKDEPRPVLRQPGPIKRWLLARQARKWKAEHEQRLADDARMDELLDKIAKQGRHSLSDEEQRFMERVSARYRNKS